MEYKSHDAKIKEVFREYEENKTDIYNFLFAILPECKRGLKRIDKKMDYYDGKREFGCRESTIDKYFEYSELSEIGHSILKSIEIKNNQNKK